MQLLPPAAAGRIGEGKLCWCISLHPSNTNHYVVPKVGINGKNFQPNLTHPETSNQKSVCSQFTNIRLGVRANARQASCAARRLLLKQVGAVLPK